MPESSTFIVFVCPCDALLKLPLTSILHHPLRTQLSLLRCNFVSLPPDSSGFRHLHIGAAAGHLPRVHRVTERPFPINALPGCAQSVPLQQSPTEPSRPQRSHSSPALLLPCRVRLKAHIVSSVRKSRRVPPQHGHFQPQSKRFLHPSNIPDGPPSHINELVEIVNHPPMKENG